MYLYPRCICRVLTAFTWRTTSCASARLAADVSHAQAILRTWQFLFFGWVPQGLDARREYSKLASELGSGHSIEPIPDC